MGGIAVHCVAGLGRAPVLVAIALIEAGMEAYSAIQFVREKRRGAINEKQIRFLEGYSPMRKASTCGCNLM
jgi:protein tyrosine phosphatase type 4A